MRDDLRGLLAVVALLLLAGCGQNKRKPLSDHEAATFFVWETCEGHQYDCLKLGSK